MVMKTFNIENLVPGELKIYKNGLLVETITIEEGTTEYQYEGENGVYLFDNEGAQDAEAYLDSETRCKVYSKRCIPGLIEYYIFLDLIGDCASKYKEAVEIYDELIKLIEDDCECLS
jgi:hypothetical protein